MINTELLFQSQLNIQYKASSTRHIKMYQMVILHPKFHLRKIAIYKKLVNKWVGKAYIAYKLSSLTPLLLL